MIEMELVIVIIFQENNALPFDEVKKLQTTIRAKRNGCGKLVMRCEVKQAHGMLRACSLKILNYQAALIHADRNDIGARAHERGSRGGIR